MNWKQLFIVSSIFWVSLLVFTQCAQQSPKQGGSVAAPALNVYEGTSCPTKGNMPDCPAIKSQFSAYGELGAWVSEALEAGLAKDPSLKDTSITVSGKAILADSLARELVQLKGFAFSYHEVKGIIDAADSNGKVYIMFAVNNDTASVNHRKANNSPILYMDTYFQVKEKGQENYTIYRPKTTGIKQDDFADFPLPCPSSCPPGL